jgi:hypothetical protein
MNEKDRVYQELAATRAKVATLKAEVRRLNTAMGKRTTPELTAERQRLRKALSYIAFSPLAPVDGEYFRQVAAEALNPPPTSLTRGTGKAAKEFRAGRRESRVEAQRRAEGAA